MSRQNYDKSKIANKAELVDKYENLVKHIAYTLFSRMPQVVQMNDLIQAGMMGLIMAADNYDPEKGAGFETYATIRIRGMILDELRRSNWVPRSVHRYMRDINDAKRLIENETGREATPAEIAAALGVDIDEYFSMYKDIKTTELYSLEDENTYLPASSSNVGPFEDVQDEDMKSHINDLISELPERSRKVVTSYYHEQRNFKEIGAELGVSEARICQIHGQAIAKLQNSLHNSNSQSY